MPTRVPRVSDLIHPTEPYRVARFVHARTYVSRVIRGYGCSVVSRVSVCNIRTRGEGVTADTGGKGGTDVAKGAGVSSTLQMGSPDPGT